MYPIFRGDNQVVDFSIALLLKSSDPTHPQDSYTIEIAPDPFEKTDGNRLLGINTVFTLNSIKKLIISNINQISVKVNATISDVLEMKELEGIWQNKVTFEVILKYFFKYFRNDL